MPLTEDEAARIDGWERQLIHELLSDIRTSLHRTLAVSGAYHMCSGVPFE